MMLRPDSRSDHRSAGTARAHRPAVVRESSMMSVSDVCALVGLPASTVVDWAARGRCIAIEEAPGRLSLPRWQFRPRVLKTLPQLSVAFGLRTGREWMDFMETPLDALGGATPRRLLEQGQAERVFALALQHAV
jgi:hypothetical protein